MNTSVAGEDRYWKVDCVKCNCKMDTLQIFTTRVEPERIKQEMAHVGPTSNTL